MFKNWVESVMMKVKWSGNSFWVQSLIIVNCLRIIGHIPCLDICPPGKWWKMDSLMKAWIVLTPDHWLIRTERRALHQMICLCLSFSSYLRLFISLLPAWQKQKQTQTTTKQYQTRSSHNINLATSKIVPNGAGKMA